jgi:hypothetical protein
MEEMMAVLSIQSQQPRAEDPSHHTSSFQVISISPSPLENLPEKQTPKETPPSPSPLANPPEQQLTKTTAPPKINPSVHPLPKPTAPPQITPAEPSPPKIPTKTQKKHLLAKTESSAPSITSKNSTKLNHQQATPSPTVPTPKISQPSHPLPDFLNPSFPIPQDHPWSATNQKNQTKKTTPIVETQSFFTLIGPEEGNGQGSNQ